MKELRAILFFHSHLREQDIKKIFPLLGPITIFQPWFMVPPNFLSQKEYQSAVRILNPPSHMKPENNFKGLLSEYKTWIEHNRDKSRAAFLKVNQEMGSDENSTWKIREALRGRTDSHTGSARALRGSTDAHAGSARALKGSDRDQQNQGEGLSLKWHLVLHLARDMEKEQQEADRILKVLKEKKSPLEDLLGKEDVKNPLTDLSQFESDPGTVSYPLELVFNAWFGLFGEYLRGGDLLLTINRHVMDYASEAWDASEEKVGGDHASLIRFKYPDLSDYYSGDELIGIDKKTFRDDRVMALWNLIRDLGKGHESDLSRLEELTKEVEAVYQKKLSEKTLHVTVKGFFPFSNQHTLKDNGMLKYLSGKAMILVEDELPSE